MAGEVLGRREALGDARGTREEAEEIDTDGDLVDRGADRLARVLALEPAQLVRPGLERVRDLQQDQRAVLGRRVLPGLEGGLGGVHRAIDVLGGARRHVRDDLGVRRVLDLEGLAARRRDELAVDELLVRLDPLHHVGHGDLLIGLSGHMLSPEFEGAAPDRRANRTDAGTILAHGVVSDQPPAAAVPALGGSRLAHSLPRPGGVIFDLDGTLVDTVSARIDGWVEALHAAGIAAAPDTIAPMIGMDGKRLAREVAGSAGRSLSEADVEATDKAAGAAFDRLNRAPRPLPGVAELLAALEDAGLSWVIATSSRKEQVAGSVAALGLQRQPEIVDGSHVEHAKPAPDLLLLAAERLGVAPGRVWAVGDSTWDMRAAVAGGLIAIGVTAGSAVSADDLTGAGASLVVPTLTDLARLIRARVGARSSPRSRPIRRR